MNTAMLAAGFGALALGGRVEAGLALFGFVLAAVSPRVLQRLPWVGLAVCAMGLAGLLQLFGSTLGVLLLLIGLQVHRASVRSGRTDDQVAAAIALLMLLQAAPRADSPLFGLCVAVFALSVPAVLAGQRWAAGLVAPVVAVGALVFVLMPRPASPDTAVTGFVTDLKLGSLGSVTNDSSVVVEVHPRPSQARVYLRGAALNQFDGNQWTSTSPHNEAVPVGDPTGSIKLVFDRAPVVGGVLFTTGSVVAVDGAVAADRVP